MGFIMIEQLAAQIRSLVYTVICFHCILQITQGSTYQRYLKFFVYLLTLCSCCQMLLFFVGKINESWQEADSVCEEWIQEWIGDDAINEAALEQYSRSLEQRIQEQAIEEYERREQENEQSATEAEGIY